MAYVQHEHINCQYFLNHARKNKFKILSMIVLSALVKLYGSYKDVYRKNSCIKPWWNYALFNSILFESTIACLHEYSNVHRQHKTTEGQQAPNGKIIVDVGIARATNKWTSNVSLCFAIVQELYKYWTHKT